MASEQSLKRALPAPIIGRVRPTVRFLPSLLADFENLSRSRLALLRSASKPFLSSERTAWRSAILNLAINDTSFFVVKKAHRRGPKDQPMLAICDRLRLDLLLYYPVMQLG